MADRLLWRIGAVAGLAGALAQLTATALEPEWGDDAAETIRIVADSEVWTGDRLLDLVGVLLTVGALTVAGRTFAPGPGREWARVGQVFLVLMGALGCAAIVLGATMKDVADAWASAAPDARQSYLATFDATSTATENLFFAAFLSLGLYLAALAMAIRKSGVHSRWIGWASAVAAVLLLAGDLLLLASDLAFVAVVLGFLVFLAVLVALALVLWRWEPPQTGDAKIARAGSVPPAV